MDWVQTTAWRDKKHLSFGIWCDLYWTFNCMFSYDITYDVIALRQQRYHSTGICIVSYFTWYIQCLHSTMSDSRANYCPVDVVNLKINKSILRHL